MLDALSPQRRRLVLVVVAIVLVAVLAGVVVGVVRGRSTPAPVRQDTLGPVLLVPGYGGGVDALDPLANALRSAGRSVVIVAVGDGTGDLVAAAQGLGRAAVAARDAARADSVDVIGYSAGGVVARLWVRDEGGAGVARRVLTLGSPHHGTSTAELGAQLGGGCPTACRQLVPGSDLLRQLNAGDETPAGPQWATVRSNVDVVVTPTDSAALDGAVNVVIQDLCPGSRSNHGDLPGDPVTLAMIDSALGTGPVSAPTDVSC